MSREDYSLEHVRTLIEEYAGLRERVDTTAPGLRPLVQLVDLSKALRHLRRDYLAAVLLCGLIGLPQDEAARLLEVSQQAVSKRYRRALEEIHYLINGGD